MCPMNMTDVNDGFVYSGTLLVFFFVFFKRVCASVYVIFATKKKNKFSSPALSFVLFCIDWFIDMDFKLVIYTVNIKEYKD